MATILVLRNARHHNQANKIRTIYAYKTVKVKAKYIFVDFPLPEEDASTMELYISWEDFKTLLSQDKAVTKIKDETVSLINTYLNTKLFNEYTKHYKVSENKIFLNVVPLFVNAGNKIMPFIKDYCNHDSTESKLFKALFLNGIIANTYKHEVNCGTILI